MGPRTSIPLLLGVLALTGAAAGRATAGPAAGGSTSCGCTPTTHQVIVPGIAITPPLVNIGLPSIGVGVGVGQASASGVGTASASGVASSNVSVSVTSSGSSAATSSVNQNAAALLSTGGGSGSWSAEAGVSTDITEIKTESPAPPVAAPPICTTWKSAFREIAVQAICLDDKAAPHPASQVSPDRAVAPGYEGEVFRCIAGARMQYTIAEVSGAIDFNHGQTVVCQKGEALYHSAGGGLQCRPQKPARDCNERSLLRRFGAGIKVMTASGDKVCVAWRPQGVAAAPAPAGPQVLN
jgi:hypothetical protein